ncbi:MAG: ATP synthase F1 subunit delta [Chloroherpetonaceae bacterium]|nr:ATP synthase F1 subunit delta [Chloroherpetonaceae bacterium]MCS7211893.1 ATP synthase F1 subunit delta [Chloroherpetonaceae bacterium]MDW8019668.1 ATP synthase F1 subunit delta [Chloroherpetonaceae bacterium]MDW8465259.1 ATP synthase F1 subunit delta [Chloroherpetonaceae bacterium]
MKSRVGLRYATAILQGAGEDLPTVAQDLELVKQILAESKELSNVLKSPIVKDDDKIAILKQVFIGRISIKTLEALELLVRKGRSAFIADTIAEFQALLDAQNGVLNAEVCSAVELDDTQKNLISAQLERLMHKKVRLSTKVMPALIGGLTIRIGDTVIDSSVKHQLERLRGKFKQAVLN